MAAYRLRSFSESESWNIRIECSISGLYVMGGRPLRGLDRPCYRYTIRTGIREVIELAILNRSRTGCADPRARGPAPPRDPAPPRAESGYGSAGPTGQ